MQNSGQCHCGAVTFKVEGAPVRMGQCHCNACRRITGTGHNVQAFFKKEQVTIEGKTQTHDSVSDRGNVRTRHFCPTCGSRLFSENSAAPGGIGIAAGAFDNSDWYKPDLIVYYSERPIWDFVDPSIEAHDKMYASMSFQTDELVERLRIAFGDRPHVQEKRMFGGIAFMLNGNMLCGITNKSQFMVRVGKDLEPEARKLPGAADMDFTGKKMAGMLFVDNDAIEDDEALEKWLILAERFVGTLPPK